MPPVAVIALFSVLAFFLAGVADYLEARHIQAVARHTAGDPEARETAARLSVAMLVVGVTALYACVEITWFLVIPEAAGLYLGTKFALRG